MNDCSRPHRLPLGPLAGDTGDSFAGAGHFPAATWLPRESRTMRINQDETVHRLRTSLRSHCRAARWLSISACAGRVRVPPIALLNSG